MNLIDFEMTTVRADLKIWGWDELARNLRCLRYHLQSGYNRGILSNLGRTLQHVCSCLSHKLDL
jgi:hypothetical protein